jgi:pyruvate dehydrogenase E2 component (dihydrolipoamide acetyltransferase)
VAEFRMPSLGADMEAGTVLEWMVKPGDEVHRGDIVAVVDTDKADIDVEIFESGVIDELLVPVGERVPVGTPLATVTIAGAPRAQPAVATKPAAEPRAEQIAEPIERPRPKHVDGAVHSPVIRRLAEHLKVDLTQVQGTGPSERITRADVERAATPAVTAAAPAATEAAPDRALSMRRAIAGLMSRANRDIPHYYVATDVDLDAALTWLAGINETRAINERALPVVLLLKASALAARQVPEVNGFWLDDRLQCAPNVHLGVAVSLRGGGLVAPAIHDADEKDLDTLMRELRDVVQRARSGHLRSSEMADPTITVTSLGDQGVDEVYGVIYPPQVALVGVGRIARRPVAVEGLIGVHPVVRMTLAGDHRATDGHTGARYLAAVERLLQRPEELWTRAPL